MCVKSSNFAPFLHNLKISIKNMKNLTFLRFCLCAVMFTLFSTSVVWGAKLCQSGYTGTIGALGSKTVSVSIGTIGTNTYRVVFESDFAMTGSLSYLVISGNDNFCLNSATKRIFDGGHKIFFDISSTSAPTFKNNIQVQTSAGNWTLTGTAVNTIDWSQTTSECPALEAPAGGTDKLYWVKPQGYSWTTPLYAYMWNGGTNNTWPGVTISSDEQVTLDYGDADIYEWDYSSSYNMLKLHDKNDANNMDGLNIYGANMYYVPTIMSNATTVTNWKWCASQDMNLQIGNAADNYYNNDASHKFAFSAGLGNTLTRTVTLAANTVYYFKLAQTAQTQGNSWYTNSTASATAGVGQMSSSDCTDWNMAYNGYDDKPTKLLTTEPGEYTFVYDYTRDRLSVIYPNQMHTSTACSGISNEIIEGSDFYYGYDFSTLGNGDVQIQFEWLGDGEPVNIYFHDWTSGGLVETGMTRSGKVGTKTISGKSAGDIIIFGCKFEAPGACRTRKFVYKVGYDCSVAECSESGNVAAGKLTKAGYSRMYVAGKGGRNDVEQPQFAVDGKTTSHFIAYGAANAAEDAHRWFAVDLGAEYDLSNIKIYWQEIGRSSSNYVLQTRSDLSDDFENDAAYSNTGWTTIKTVTETQVIGSANSYDVIGTGRYVRLVALDRKDISISEFEVYISRCPSDDSNPPTMTAATYVSNNVGNTGAIVELTATDLEGDVSRFRLDEVGGGTTYVNTDGSHHATLDGLSSGPHTYHVYAIDGGGNISANYVTLSFCFLNPAENLALNKTCYAGHETGNPAEVKSKANDGNLATFWTSYGGAVNTDDWWYVDLGHIFSLSEIDLYWFYNSAAAEEDRRLGSEDYIIQVRQTAPVGAQITNEDEWTTVAHETNPKCGQTENTDKNAYLVDIDARYVRVQSKQRNHLGQQIRLNEMLVYGTGCGTLDENAPVVTASLYSVGVGQATLNVAATDTEDGAIYDFYITNSVTGVTTAYTDDNHDGKVTITGLENCTTYSFTVKAKDKAVNWSNNVVVNSVTPVNSNTINLAVNATTTAGYTEGGVAANTALAVDGDLATQWQSTGATAGTNEWYKVDLGQMYDLNEVKVRWGLVAGNDDGGDYPVDYKFQVSSDNTNWASFAHFNYKASTGAYQIISTSSDPLPARYVRIWVDAHDTYAMGIRELEVYSKNGCYEADGKPVITLAEVANVNPTSADIHCESWAEGKTHAELRYYYEIYENGAAIPVATGTKTHTSGNFTFTELDKGSSYSVKIWAEIISSGVRSDNYKVINFSATYSSLHYLTEETACNWTDGLYKSAWQFKYTERYSPTEEDENGDPLMILEYIDHTIINDVATTPPTIQYKLYEAGYGGIWTTGANLFFRNPKDKALKMYALGTDKFVCNLDELYVSGEAVGGWWTTSNAPTSATAVDYRMRYDAETGLFSWTGDVVPGADKHFKIVIRDIRAVDAASDTWAYNRIMDTNKDYDRDWTRATLYFDMSTWTWWWEKAMEGGCVRKGGPGTVNPDNAGTPFTDGYIIDAYVINEGGNDYFIVEAESYDADAQDNGILHIYKSENNAAVTEVYKEGGAAKTYTVGTTTYKYYRFKKLVSEISEAVNGIIRYYVKFEGPDGIIRNTEYHYFDLVHNECVPDRWVIYHHDQAPEVGDIETFAGGVIVPPIEYRRKFDLDTWYTIYLPFDVTAVQVIDGDDYYDLKPYYRKPDGTIKSKNYIIRKANPVTNMPVEDVENKLPSVSPNGWFDPTYAEFEAGFLPAKNTPYLIQFHNAYYADKWIAFKGTRYSTIDTEFATQTAPTADEMLNIYGNNTMKNRTISSQCYQLNYEEYGGSAWTRFDNITLYPFECYILANSTTTAKYRILRRGAGEDDTTTDLEDVYEENGTVYVYTMAGQLLYTFNNVTPDEAGQQLQNRLMEGVYILRTVKNSYKLIIGGR